jgi:hypothetical protein
MKPRRNRFRLQRSHTETLQRAGGGHERERKPPDHNPPERPPDKPQRDPNLRPPKPEKLPDEHAIPDFDDPVKMYRESRPAD